MSPLQIILIVVLAILAFGFLYETYAQARDRRRYPAPGRFVDVGGYRLHVQMMGEGQPGPTVILDAGMVSFSSNWAWVQPAVATAAPTLAIDRAGFGWSDRGPKPRSAGQSARELHATLEKLNLPRPYVLVGHSYGGLTARAYASLYRDEVAGMVLVDASHPDQWVRMGLPSKVMGTGNYVFSFLSRFGLLRLWSTEYRLLATGLPPRQYGELMAYSRIQRSLAAGGAAAAVWDSISRAEANAISDLGDLPLVVLSVTEQPIKGAQLTELQAELLRLSTNSEQIIVQGASHEGLVSQEANARVVTQAILKVVDAARRRGPQATAESAAVRSSIG